MPMEITLGKSTYRRIDGGWRAFGTLPEGFPVVDRINGQAECDMLDEIERLRNEREEVREKAEHLEKFKAYTHERLGGLGVPQDPDPWRTKYHGCRVGVRFDWLQQRLVDLTKDNQERSSQVAELAVKVVTAERECDEARSARRQVEERCAAYAKFIGEMKQAYPAGLSQVACPWVEGAGAAAVGTVPDGDFPTDHALRQPYSAAVRHANMAMRVREDRLKSTDIATAIGRAMVAWHRAQQEGGGG